MARTTEQIVAIHLSGQPQRWAVYVRWPGGPAGDDRHRAPRSGDAAGRLRAGLLAAADYNHGAGTGVIARGTDERPTAWIGADAQLGRHHAAVAGRMVPGLPRDALVD